MEPVLEFRCPDSTTVFYGCSNCKYMLPSADVDKPGQRERAAACCMCTRCGQLAERRHHLLCNACQVIVDAERQTERRRKLLELPVVPDDGGPVYVDETERWYDDAQLAIDHLVDDSIDPATVIVHPATVGRVATPSLIDYVDEAWGAEYDDEYYDGLPDAVGALLAECQAAIEQHAPTIYTARSKERIQLPTVSVDA